VYCCAKLLFFKTFAGPEEVTNCDVLTCFILCRLFVKSLNFAIPLAAAAAAAAPELHFLLISANFDCGSNLISLRSLLTAEEQDDEDDDEDNDVDDDDDDFLDDGDFAFFDGLDLLFASSSSSLLAKKDEESLLGLSRLFR